MPAAEDLIIRNASLHDGLGNAPVMADIAVSGGRITRIGSIAAGAREEIDAGGLALAPGFIDTHTHDDRAVSRTAMSPKTSQGVTTVVTGNCGFSLAPFRWGRPCPSPLNQFVRAPEDAFASFADWFGHLESAGIGPNVLALAGHSTVRAMVMDVPSGPSTPAEAAAMRSLIDQAMDDGVAGMSTGLEYGPAVNATTDEIADLAARVAARGGLYTTHMRNEADRVREAMDEAFAIGERAHVPVLISHFKCSGSANFGRSRETIAAFDAARERMDVSLDAYPYDACSTELRLDYAVNSRKVLIAGSDPHPEAAGRHLSALAAQWKLSLEETIDRLNPALAVYFDMDEADVRAILAYPHTMIGSDGIPEGTHPHPRLWGTFARVLGHYARDVRLFPLEEAIRRMTSLPAARFGLAGRGVLREGAAADLVLFDPATVIDRATFEDPVQPAAGIHAVWVNGETVWRDGRSTPASPGRVLRRLAA